MKLQVQGNLEVKTEEAFITFPRLMTASLIQYCCISAPVNWVDTGAASDL